MKNILNLSLLLLFFTACSSDEDDDVMLCDTGPVVLQLEVLEAGTEVNLIETGVYTKSQIRIVDGEGEAVSFDLDNGTSLSMLLGWEEKTDTYTVSLGEEIVFDIVYSLENIVGEFCTFTQLKQLEITGLDYEQDQSSGIIRVFVAGE